jgi:hypothetical protein
MNRAVRLGRKVARLTVKRWTRDLRRKAEALARRITAPLRPLPDFLIIGSHKAGTRSLYHNLCSHPGILPCLGKEPDFFTFQWGRGVLWYRSLFPMRRFHSGNASRLADRTVTGEGSTSYLFAPHCPKNVRDVIPHVRIIVMLRNPVDRCYSHYHHNVRRSREPLPFEDALEEEERRTSESIKRMIDDPAYLEADCFHYAYLKRSIYVDQLARWLSAFPSDQLLVLKSEGVFSDPQKAFDRVFTFLGVRPIDIPEARIHGDVNQAAPMRQETRQRLTAFFEPHNMRLNELLGEQFF